MIKLAYIDFKKAIQIRIEGHVKIIIVSCVEASPQFSLCCFYFSLSIHLDLSLT